MNLDLNLDKYSELDGKTQMTEVAREIAGMDRVYAEYKRLLKSQALVKLSQQLDEEDPDRIKHKFTQADADTLLEIMGMKGIISTISGSLISNKLALEEYAETTDKHSEWLSKIKYRSYYGELLGRSVYVNKYSEKPEVQHYYSMVNVDGLDLSATVNNVLDQIQTQVSKRYTDMFKDQEIAELKHTVTQLENDMVDNTNMLNDRLDKVEKSVDMKWQDRAIQLKAATPRITNKELVDIVGMKIDTVKKFMGKSDTKAQILSIQDNA